MRTICDSCIKEHHLVDKPQTRCAVCGVEFEKESPRTEGPVDDLVRFSNSLGVERWCRCVEALPPVIDKTQDSDYLLCVMHDAEEPFIGWYNEGDNCWYCCWPGGYEEVNFVTHWMYLPTRPLNHLEDAEEHF